MHILKRIKFLPFPHPTYTSKNFWNQLRHQKDNCLPNKVTNEKDKDPFTFCTKGIIKKKKKENLLWMKK